MPADRHHGQPRGTEHGSDESGLSATGRRFLDIAYVSPEWRYHAGDRHRHLRLLAGPILYAGWVWLTLVSNPLDLIPGEQMVTAIGGLALAHLVTDRVGEFLARRGDRALVAGPAAPRLQGVFERGRFWLRIERRWQPFEAKGAHQFSMREHEHRHGEARAEERARTLGFGQRPDHYRRAWQIVLDHGSRRYVLASVAEESAARTLVRRLHKLDGFVKSEAGAGTRTGTGEESGVAPLGRRPGLE